MGAPYLLRHLHNAGFTLALADGGGIRITPAGALTDDLRQEIRTHKPELIALLTEPAPAIATPVIALPADEPGAAVMRLIVSVPADTVAEVDNLLSMRRRHAARAGPGAQGATRGAERQRHHREGSVPWGGRPS